MCGIVGIAGKQGAPGLSQMNATQLHRGPDDSGEFRDEEAGVSLAMHRLSILDLNTGHQPMSNFNGDVLIVFNGEIFNSPELRIDLERRGHRFVTKNSDTEVLLRLYEEKQENMLHDLNGMFAFVIYDRPRRLLFGARDRVGIKPLYYSANGSTFAFASEPKALLTLPWLGRDVDPESLFHYMSLRFIPGEASIFRGVRRLAPGHWFKFNLAKRELTTRRYWRIDFHRQEERSVDDWTTRIRQELRDAVRRWVLSDVPVGCSLSGGLDSSAIVGLLAESGCEKIRTYSLGFTGPREEEWNELPLAREVARRWGAEHHELILTPDDLLKDLLKMVWHLDEPYGGGLPSWYVFKLMHGDVKVGLTGTGGDELFGDYGRFRRLETHSTNGAGNREGTRRPALKRVLQTVAPVLQKVPDRWIDARKKHELANLSNIDSDPFRWYYFNTYYYFPDDTKRRFVFSMDTAGISDTSVALESRYAQSGTGVVRDGVTYLSLATQLPEEFLLMTDRFSMAHSMEARVPFLDHRFVELMSCVPADVRTRRGDLKYLLRRAVGDLLPPKVLNARKRGFVIPIELWLRGQLRPLVDRLLAPDRLRAQALFRPDFHARFVQPHLAGKADNSAQVWTALMFQLWHVLFIEQRLTEAPRFSWQDLY